MGIKGLTKLLGDECPESMKECEIENYTGRTIAIDASMAIYQFLIAVRSGSEGVAAQMLTSEAGEVTSHIQGMFNRTIRMLSAGIKPIFVFDGKPPTMKSGELAKRYQKREQAEADLKEATEAGTIEEVERYSKRIVRATKQHSNDCKTLLRLMGVPVLDAPCEAEAQCAALSAAGIVFAAATEDMDALTFRAPRLLRRLTFSGKDNSILEVDLEKVLKGLKLTFDQFVDLCILCGCDYCGNIKGIGPKTALDLIRKYGSIDKMLPTLGKKYDVPPEWYPHKRTKKPKDARAHKKPAAAAEKVGEDGDKKPAAVESGEKTGAETEGEEGGVQGEGEAQEGDNDKHEEAAEADGEGARMEQDDVEKKPTEEDDTAENKQTEAGGEDVQEGGITTTGLAAAAATVLSTSEEKGEEGEAMQEDVVESEGGKADGAEGEDHDDDDDQGPATEVAEEEEEQNGVDEDELLPPIFQEARRLFMEPDIADPKTFDVKWTDPDEAGLKEFLVDKLGFNPDRVTAGIKKLQQARGKSSQRRLDSFFKSAGSSTSSSAAVNSKRKEPDTKGKGKGPATKKGSGASSSSAAKGKGGAKGAKGGKKK